MDNQCDRCGKELPKCEIPEELKELGMDPDTRVAYHLLLGGENVIFSDGDYDWQPDTSQEFDLCPKCKGEFKILWRDFYGK